MMSESELQAFESCRKRNRLLREALSWLIDDCNDCIAELQTSAVSDRETMRDMVKAVSRSERALRVSEGRDG